MMQRQVEKLVGHSTTEKLSWLLLLLLLLLIVVCISIRLGIECRVLTSEPQKKKEEEEFGN